MSTIFAKFGFNPNKSTTEETTQVESPSVDPPTVSISKTQTSSIEAPSKMSIDPPVAIRHTTPNLDDSDSDDSLPSPSKIAHFLTKKAEKQPTPTEILPSPRKVHFTLPPPLPLPTATQTLKFSHPQISSQLMQQHQIVNVLNVRP